MKQFLLPGAPAAGQQVELVGEDYHYLSRVLRLKPGSRLPGLDEAGNRWSIEILTDDGSVILARTHRVTSAALSVPRITLYQAILKGKKLDDSIRQLVQFGVRRICPVVTDRTIVRPDGGGIRVERWQRIAREAVQQSGADRSVEIVEPVPLAEVRPAAGALSLLLHAHPLAQTSLHGYLGDIPDEIELIVGPEGGFADSELSQLLSSGFNPLWLGPQILRSETAALFAAAALRLLIVEHASWQPARP